MRHPTIGYPHTLIDFLIFLILESVHLHMIKDLVNNVPTIVESESLTDFTIIIILYITFHLCQL